MPLYDYECVCGWEGEEFQRMDDRHKMACPKCGRPADLVIKPQPRYVPFPHYFDIGLGEEITSYAQRRRVMREQHCDHRDPPSKGDIAAWKDKSMARRKEHIRRGGAPKPGW